MRYILLILITLYSLSGYAANAKLDTLKFEYTYNADSTYTLIVTQKLTVLSNFGAEQAQKNPITYYPDTESFKLLDAHIIKANGKKIPVAPAQIFTRSAASRASAPGFDNRLTTTVVYPTLSNHDSTYLRYQIVHKKPSEVGIGLYHAPELGIATQQQDIVINLPKSLFLRWTKLGPFQVTDTVRGQRRWIHARLTNFPERYPENNMANLGNNLPYFMASGSTSWEEVGSKVWRLFKDKIDQTPEIKSLASDLTRNKHGVDAVRAIHNYVAQNIHYIAVYFDESAGIVPHKASDVLHNGYGDCKDNAVLMIALLNAAGIEANPVLIQAGTDYYRFPLPNGEEFNHAMVYIPSLKQFANPTSEYSSFGVTDSYIANKFVLVAGEHPFTTYTPKGRASDSVYTSTKTLTLTKDGDIRGENRINVSGRVNAGSRALFAGTIPKRLAKKSLENSEGGTGNLDSSDPRDLDHDMLITANWQSPQAFNIDDDAYFTIPRGIDFKSPDTIRSLIQLDQRKYPMIIGAGTVNWQLVIRLPEHFDVIHLPKNRRFQNAAGQYTSAYSAEHGKLIVSRTFLINQDVYAPSEYPALKALLYESVKDARSVVGIKRMTNSA